MIISLTGFMGCGKSSVGRELSKLLCCPFMDLDDIIEKKSGRSISDIFKTEGEASFRHMELESLQELAGQMPICSRGPLPLRGSLPLAGGGKMPLPHKWHTDQNSADPDKNIQVLALGGGTVMTPECAELVHEKTLCVYLRASVETLVSHLEDESSGRPMLKGESLRARIQELMDLRSATYENTAHIIIDTDGKSIEAIASEIASTILN